MKQPYYLLIDIKGYQFPVLWFESFGETYSFAMQFIQAWIAVDENNRRTDWAQGGADNNGSRLWEADESEVGKWHLVGTVRPKRIEE